MCKKSRAELKAERKAKQDAKRAARATEKGKEGKSKQDPRSRLGQAEAETPAAAPGEKSKAQLRAERRAVQEAQRAAKEEKKKASEDKDKVQLRVPDNVKADVGETQKRIAKLLGKQQIPQRASSQRKVALFAHLLQYEKDPFLTSSFRMNSAHMPAAVIRLGLQYSNGIICGSNARCVALLGVLKQIIRDYSTPPDKDLSRDLDAKIKPCIAFLNQCRPMSVSMGSAIKYIKFRINQLGTDKETCNLSEDKMKSMLLDSIDDFYRIRIDLPGKAIADCAVKKIEDRDVILVYGFSSLLLRVLCAAHDNNVQFRVVVCDGRPRNEGRVMLHRLLRHGVDCSYVCISAAAHCMSEVNKVFLGAHGLLANGHVMSRVGSAQIALIAKSWCVPVLVCCETYKFTERALTDSFVFNELGDPSFLAEDSQTLQDWQKISNLYLLNLAYDVTPSELVTMVITELGALPCTSVPVVLRVRPVEMTY